MADGILLDIPPIIRIINVSKSFSTTITTELLSTTMSLQTIQDISPVACFGFAVLILTTIFGNILVLAALFLDKRLHTPSFFLIANMAMADLLLGIFVLPFSSILELLNDRWIFGQAFCSTWLALDVLCCTASIIALMAVSIDRYIGVTQPLTYSRTMTIRRTIYLILIVWAISILTSVVPLFGLTDRGKMSSDTDDAQTCNVNKNTFYTIFSSSISFYIPVIILLILYSRVYQEAKKQGEKLEKEKRRLYQIDCQVAYAHSQEQQQHQQPHHHHHHHHQQPHHHQHHHHHQQQQRQQEQQNQPNGHMRKNSCQFDLSDEQKIDALSIPLSINHIPDEECCLDRAVTSTDVDQSRPDYPDLKNKKKDDDDTSHSGSSTAPAKKHRTRHLLGKNIFSSIKRNSLFHSNPNLPRKRSSVLPLDELMIIKRKLHHFKREKKAFRSVGLILGALLICWLPFFVTLPLFSILKHHGISYDEKTENTWFKITFWLGYCNSALNPFVYAFSNRAIRRAFRQVICRRFCCCMCRKKGTYDHSISRRQRYTSTSLTTDLSQGTIKRTNSYIADVGRMLPKVDKELDALVNSPPRSPNTGVPVVSFADFLVEKNDENEQKTNSDVPETLTEKGPIST